MAKDIMMWVGESYYPTIEDFIAEAREKGVCKRIGTVPDIIAGQSRCFLLHRNGTNTPRCFCYFVISTVLVLVSGADLSDLTAKYRNSVRYASRKAFPAGDRGCGEMQAGGLYMVSQDVFDEAARNASDFSLEGGLVVFKQPYPKMSRHLVNFRGYQYIDGNALMDTFREEYQKHQQKESQI